MVGVGGIDVAFGDSVETEDVDYVFHIVTDVYASEFGKSSNSICLF